METLFVDRFGNNVVATPGEGTKALIERLSGTNNLNFILISNKAPRPKALDVCDPINTVIFTLYLELADLCDDDEGVDSEAASRVVDNWNEWLDEVHEQFEPRGFYFMHLHPTALSTQHGIEDTLREFNQGVALYEQGHVCKRVN